MLLRRLLCLLLKRIFFKFRHLCVFCSCKMIILPSGVNRVVKNVRIKWLQNTHKSQNLKDLCFNSKKERKLQKKKKKNQKWTSSIRSQTSWYLHKRYLIWFEHYSIHFEVTKEKSVYGINDVFFRFFWKELETFSWHRELIPAHQWVACISMQPYQQSYMLMNVSPFECSFVVTLVAH